MFRATKDVTLPTTITGSLPRPSWYTENLGTRTFLEAMVNAGFREQYTDALAVYLHDQEVAGLPGKYAAPRGRPSGFRRAAMNSSASPKPWLPSGASSRPSSSFSS